MRPPTPLLANVSVTLQINPAASRPVLIALVAQAITASIDGLPIGAGLAWARLTQLAFNASPDVYNLANLTLNGGTADLLPGPSGIVRAGTVTVS